MGMGEQLSVDHCALAASPENQRVRECCYLEGETPVEICIARTKPRPQRLPSFAHTGAAFAHAFEVCEYLGDSPGSIYGIPGGGVARARGAYGGVRSGSMHWGGASFSSGGPIYALVW